VKTKEELALLKECDQVWNVVGVLNYLQAGCTARWWVWNRRSRSTVIDWVLRVQGLRF